MRRFHLKNNVLFYLILFAGLVLRIYSWLTLPLNHDELSAIHRTRFDSFSELISHGVLVDNHPALIQVFLYYYTSIFGNNTLVLRFPFIILGLLCLPLIYYIGKRLFHEGVGLFAMLMVSVSQFSITYSIYARPYVVGLFFILMLCFLFIKIFKDKKVNTSIFILSGITISLLGYTHYISGLIAFLFAVLGFVLSIKQKIFFKYLLSLSLATLLYVPHIPVFYKQLGNKGLEWLGTPRSDFISLHFQYLFHYSWIAGILMLSLLILWVIKPNKTHGLWFYRLLCLLLFLIPFGVLFYYSKIIAPIIQHSSLFFSFPFLMLLLGSFFYHHKPWSHYLLAALGTVLLFSLIVERKHFEIMKKQPFPNLAYIDQSVLHESCALYFDLNPAYLAYYYPSKKLSQRHHSYFATKPNIAEWRKVIKNELQDSILICNMYPEYEKIAEEYYPYTFLLENGSNHNLKGLTKNSAHATILPKPYTRVLSEEKRISAEYDLEIIVNLDSIPLNRHSLIELAIEFNMPKEDDPVLVMEVIKNNHQLRWSGIDLKDFLTETRASQKAYLYFPVNLLYKHKNEWKDDHLKIYIWNRTKNEFTVESIELNVRQGNPYEYALYEQI